MQVTVVIPTQAGWWSQSAEGSTKRTPGGSTGGSLFFYVREFRLLGGNADVLELLVYHFVLLGIVLILLALY